MILYCRKPINKKNRTMAKKISVSFLLFVLHIISMFIILWLILPFPEAQGFAYVAHPTFMLLFGFINALVYSVLLIRKKISFTFLAFVVFYAVSVVSIFAIRLLL